MISAAEFVRSGLFSSGLVLLQDEEFDEEGSADQPQHYLLMENAARVSLLLTRSYIDCYQVGGGDVVDVDSLDNLGWSSIQLADFFVSYEQNSESAKTAVLLGVGNLSPAKVDLPQDQGQRQNQEPTAPMKALGKLLYSVFSRGLSFAIPESTSAEDSVTTASSPLTGNLTVEDSDDVLASLFDGIDPIGRSSQRSRIAELSILTHLVDTRLFPISVCRFLSDMIDIGPRGRAETPFTSFEEISQELERMLSRPRIFLHDSYYPHHVQRPPLFGRVCHGRKEEVATLMRIADRLQQSASDESGNSPGKKEISRTPGVEAVFVTGIAGSGKSNLVQAVAEYLVSSGWILTKGKFERGKEYASVGIVSSMFDAIVSHVASLREEGDADDVAYSKRVSNAIVDAIGQEMLSKLVGFLPSLPLLLDNGVVRGDAEMISGHEPVYPLSKLLEAVLEPDRFLLICCDDLQWADKTSIDLIVEILMNLAGVKHVRGRCLFVGMYRSDEVDDAHPIVIQHSMLGMSISISTTEIKLSALSKDDVNDMVMSELRLPQRAVANLADSVYRKTAGHALFVIELLNKLLNESTIAYSTEKHCFTWDEEGIDLLEMGDNVAELLVSNISSLPAEPCSVLQILSCVGIQVDYPLLQVFEQFHKGIVESVDAFVQQGILDKAGPVVIFSHDLILQAVYEGMPSDIRQALHLKIGNHLGKFFSRAVRSPTTMPLKQGMDRIQLDEHTFFAGSQQLTSSLISLACDQINHVGADTIKNQRLRTQYAKWNLTSGQKAGHEGNFCAALHYYSAGISFVGEAGWQKNQRLSLGLYKGAMMAAYALAQSDDVIRYANILTANLPFTQTIDIEIIALKVLCVLFKYEEGKERGLRLINQLNFDIPLSPTEEMALKAKERTDAMISQYSIDDILRKCCGRHRKESKEHKIVKVLGCLFGMLHLEMEAPIYLLLTCEAVRFSLQHSVYLESALAFAWLAYFKIKNEGDFKSAKVLANVSRAIIEKNKSEKNDVASELDVIAVQCLYVDIWFQPPRDIARIFFAGYEKGLKNGISGSSEVVCCLLSALSAKVHGGENLAILAQSSLDDLKLIARYSPWLATYAIGDCVLLMELTGNIEDYFSVVGGNYNTLDDIQVEAESSSDYLLLSRLSVLNLLRSFWSGDFVTAEEHSRKAWLNPQSKYPTLFLQLHTFFGGLVSFQLYRKLGGDDRLHEGREMLERMRKWMEISTETFKSKCLLLEAEHAALFDGAYKNAEQLYKAAISAARDCGNIHEVGIAYSLFGDYYAAQGRTLHSLECFKAAYVHYKQWGASVVAERLKRKHKLEISSLANGGKGGGLKHLRECD